MASLNLTLRMMEAEGRLPSKSCAKIEKLKSDEDRAREKRVKVEREAKKQRIKAIKKLTKQVKHEIKEIDETYGKPGKPSKCSPAKKKERVEDSPELRRGTKIEQKEHGRRKKGPRQIAADHLEKDPHAYDVKPKAKKPAKPKKVKAKKVAKTKKPRAAGVDRKAKAAAKREATAAEKRAREEAKLAKREARKQAKAAAHRPQYAGETAPTSEAKPKKVKAVRAPKPKAEKPVRAAKPVKPPKPPRAKKAAVTREQVFVADEPAANGMVDADKDAKALAGLENMAKRLMAQYGGETTESMPSKAKPKPKPGYVYVWSDDESFSEFDIDVMSERHYIGARYTGRLAGDGSMFNTWKLKDGRNIAQTAIG